MQLIKKLSSKSVIGNVKKIAMEEFYLKNDVEKPNPDAKSELSLYTIYGRCRGIKTGTGDNGDWVSFEGDFKATRDIDGEVFRAPRAFISEPAAGMLQAALEAGDTVELAFNVSIVPSNNAYGYEYRCAPLLEVKETDDMLALEKKIQLRLDAPKSATAPKTKAKGKAKGKK
jgi:hypothetical protein